MPIGGTFVLGPDQMPIEGVQQLAPDTEGAFEDYVDFLVEFGFPEIDDLEVIVFSNDDTEVLRIDAPEGGFTDAASLLSAYQDALDEMQAGEAALSNLPIGVHEDGEGWQEDPDTEEDGDAAAA